MGTYIFSISLISIISAVICILCPEKYAKYVSFTASLAVMLVIISPLKSIQSITINIPEHEPENCEEDIKESASRALAQSVYEAISGKYGKADTVQNITVYTTDSESFEVEKISITLISGSQITDTGSLELYISNLYGVKTTVNET